MNTQNSWEIFLWFTLRVMVAHALTYFIFAIIAISIRLNYRKAVLAKGI